jgi:hypothetical protein
VASYTLAYVFVYTQTLTDLLVYVKL